MSIKTEAQAVRAETVAKANTAERVGKVLEDIADDLVAKQTAIDDLETAVAGMTSKAALGQVYYVSKSPVTGQYSTLNAALVAIDAAVGFTQATVIMGPGTFAETAFTKPAGKTVDIIGCGKSVTVIETGEPTYVVNANNITFRNLKLHHTGASAPVLGAATFDNCHIDSLSGHAMVIQPNEVTSAKNCFISSVAFADCDASFGFFYADGCNIGGNEFANIVHVPSGQKASFQVFNCWFENGNINVVSTLAAGIINGFIRTSMLSNASSGLKISYIDRISGLLYVNGSNVT